MPAPGADRLSSRFIVMRVGLFCCAYNALRTVDSCGSKCVGSGPSSIPVGANSHPLPSACMMKGSSPFREPVPPYAEAPVA